MGGCLLVRLRLKRLGVTEQRRGDLDLLGFGEINAVTLNGRSQRLVKRAFQNTTRALKMAKE